MKIRLLLILILVSALASCTTSDSDDGDETTDAGTTRYWTEIDWTTADNGAYASFTYEGLQPSCSNLTGTSPEFKFFSRTGSANNLVIYFQGGGACWHDNNCNTFPTYSTAIQYFENETMLDKISNNNSLAQAAEIGGIFDFTKSDNPFKDWDFVYIPYCTGDLHWGANDSAYASGTIRHRGHVNFQVVLEWLKAHYTTVPDKIFVTGISAGSYGAIFNFPFIKQAFPSSEFFMLGDAGVGVVSDDFKSSGLANWNIQLPTSTRVGDSAFTYFDSKDPTTMELTEFYTAIADYYNTGSETVNFAHYTTAWDNNQTYFYKVTLDITADSSSDWDNYEDVWCEWNEKAENNLQAIEASTDAVNANFEYFLAPGDVHTILMSIYFYTETSDGTALLDWVKSMLGDGNVFDTVSCKNSDSCEKPSTAPACP